MARSGRKTSSRPYSSGHKDSAKRRSFDAAGYAKRHARKAAKSAARSEDVYEYAPEKARRSKVALDLDRDEEMDAGAGVGNEGDGDDIEDFRMKARLIGENGEDEKIDSEDDEEIDSDGAFDEDDDERFAGFFTKQVKKKAKQKQSKVRFAEVDLNEDDEDEDEDVEQSNGDEEVDDDEESGEDDEFIDVLDILDGRGEPLNEDDEQNASTSSTHKKSLSDDNPTFRGIRNHSDEDEAEEDGEEEEQAEEDDEDDRISISLSDAEDEAEGAFDDLQNFISSLDPSSTSASSSKKRKADGEKADAQPKKRRLIKERTEAGAESEFRTQSAGLSLDDLLAPLGQGQTALEKSVKVLQTAGTDGSSSGKKKKPQTLSVPLPQRTQERLDREAAYEQTKAEVDKWSATMKRITEAEHLSFPLQSQPKGRVSNLELAAKFKPTTALESTISSLLTSANLATDASVLETEENILKANAVSVEEVAERRKELRRMRELMFRAEVKAKRVKKIKSKVYRRLRRKERDAADADNQDGVEEEGEEGRLKREVERARERATLKHKNTGKWAKKMMSRGGYGEDGDDDEDDDNMRGGRQEIEEMLSRGEKLRRRIQGRGSDEEDSASGSDADDDGDGDGGVDAAFNELKALGKDDEEPAEGIGKKGKSVFEMKFMKDAMARKQTETNKMVDDFVKEMGEEVRGGDSENENEDLLNDAPNGPVVSRTGGRMTFHPGAGGPINPARKLSAESEETSSSTLKSTDLSPPSPSSPLVITTPNAAQKLPPVPSWPAETASSSSSVPAAEPNPWLVPSDSHAQGKASRKKNEVVVDKDSSQTLKSKNKLKKQLRKLEEEKAKAKDDAVVEIEMDDVLAAPTANGAGNVAKKSKGKGKQRAMADEDESDSEVNSEVEEQEKMLKLKGKKGKAAKAFEQRELVARAFAGDNVVKDFEEAKLREIAMDAPKEVDTTLPGWGSWGGSGLKKAPPKPHLIKNIAGVDPTSRADYNKAHVIISEKRDKKAAKYLVKDLPYPYTSKAQYDRRMQQPLGPEWNTRVGFQRGTLPKVVKKMGTVINPLEKVS